MHKLLACYDYILRLASHAKATYYLFLLSVAESSFFPIPPDVMLLPMCLAQPNRIWRLAGITTIGSVLGGVIGYAIGAYAFGFIEPVLADSGYMNSYLHAVRWFEEWGFWAIFVAGFSPIPYKVFTIAGGAMGMALLPFVVASFIGRGARFYLLALLIRVFGHTADSLVRKHMDRIGWIMVGMILIGIIVLSMR
ncbi:MAG: DedA family protein [Betaproteobacteria bacterium]|nr:DedA family protein [Betaproteobacteria bacterium]